MDETWPFAANSYRKARVSCYSDIARLFFSNNTFFRSPSFCHARCHARSYHLQIRFYFLRNLNSFLFQLQLSIGTIIYHPRKFKLFNCKLFLTRETRTSKIIRQQEHLTFEDHALRHARCHVRKFTFSTLYTFRWERNNCISVITSTAFFSSSRTEPCGVCCRTFKMRTVLVSKVRDGKESCRTLITRIAPKCGINFHLSLKGQDLHLNFWNLNGVK